MQNIKILLCLLALCAFGIIVCTFYIEQQIKVLSKKLDAMLKLFGAQQKTLELLGKGHDLQLDRSDLEIKIGMTILENTANFMQFLAEQRNHSSNQSE